MENLAGREGKPDSRNINKDIKPGWCSSLDNVEKPMARCPCKDWEPLYEGSSRGFCHYFQEFTRKGEQCI
jgi:hypothetical protein